MQKIGRAFFKSASFRKYSKEIEAALIVEKADKIILEIFKGKVGFARAVSFSESTLAVSCAASPVMQELALHRQSIISSINAVFGGGKVENIRFLLKS